MGSRKKADHPPSAAAVVVVGKPGRLAPVARRAPAVVAVGTGADERVVKAAGRARTSLTALVKGQSSFCEENHVAR